MDSMFQQIFTAIMSGDSRAVIAILIAIIALLIWDRKRLVADIDKKDSKLEKVLEDFVKGNITLTEALNGVRMALVEIRAKL